MAQAQISTKRLAINKANAQMVAIVGVASFITVFCLVATKTVVSNNQYLAKVTTAKEKANRQLQNNITSYNQLKSSYAKFDSASTNIIGGTSTGTGDRDGTNSKLILDALPSSYDFPALASSVEKILSNAGLKVNSITGTDDQIAQQSNALSPNPQPVEMPFTFSVDVQGTDAAYKLMKLLEQSIRPIQVDKVTLSGEKDKQSVIIEAHTYYQPGRSVDIKKQALK